MLQKFLYEKPCHSCVAHAQDALRPAWRSPPCADDGENRRVGCAGELPTFCRPAGPRARPVSRAAAHGATRAWRHSAIALQPTWRGPPRSDSGENRLVGCAGELPAFCRAARPSARPVSRAAAYGATLPLRRRRDAPTPSDALGAPPRVESSGAGSEASRLDPQTDWVLLARRRVWWGRGGRLASGWLPVRAAGNHEKLFIIRGKRLGFAARRGSGDCTPARGGAARGGGGGCGGESAAARRRIPLHVTVVRGPPCQIQSTK